MRIENVLTSRNNAEETEQVKVTNNVSEDKEERKMKYNELLNLMDDVYEENPWESYGQYEITNWCDTVELVASAGCDEYGLDYLYTFQEASDKYYTYLADMTEESLEDIIVDCEGDLAEIGEEFKRIFWDGLYGVPDERLEEYIDEFGLEDYLSCDECIEYERENKTLEEAFVEFCAYHRCYLKDRSARTIEDYLTMFNYFSKDLKETPIKDIEAEDLKTFFNESLMKRRINIPWAKRAMSLYNQLFGYAEEYIIHDYNPMKLIGVEWNAA